MPRFTTKASVIAAMGALYFVWGTTYLGIKIGLEADLPPALFAGVRLLPAGVILLAIARLRGSSLRASAADLRVLAIVGILLLVGGQYGTFLAERSISSGIAALVVAVLPLWIALAESVVPGMRRPGPLGWCGLAVGFAGLAILLWPRIDGMQAAGPAEMIGIGIQILATWLWTAGSIVSKRRPVRVDPLVSTGYQMLIAGGVLLTLGTVLGEWPLFQLTPAGLGALAYLSIVGSCIGFGAFVYALAHLPASKVMTYAYVNPIIAVFAGWAAGSIGLVPAEPVTVSMLAGMTVIIGGVALTIAAPTRPGRESRHAARADAHARAELPAES